MNEWQSGGRGLPLIIEGPKRPNRLRVLLFLAAAIVVILFGGRTALSYWVDLLWFRSLGYGDVFWKTWEMQWGSFAVFASATFLILYGAVLALRRAHQFDLPTDRMIVIAGKPVSVSVEPALRVLGLVASVAIALITGATMLGEWPKLALFRYGPRGTTGISDPIFGRPLSFFLFTLPAWHLLIDWLLTLSVITCIFAVVFLMITSGARAVQRSSRLSHSPAPWRGLSIAVALLLLLTAINVYIGRFDSQSLKA